MAKKTPKSGVLVGLLGESSNDTASVEALLKLRYGGQVTFVAISPDDITGSLLDNPKLQHILRKNYRFKRPDLVVVTRDLDAPETDRTRKLACQGFFRKMNKGLEGRGVHLLNVYAMEALILADIRVFNARYKCACAAPPDPMAVANPVAFLKNATPTGKPHYDEGHCASLLSKVNYATVLDNCRYFKAFDKKFAARLATLTAHRSPLPTPPA